MPAVRTSTFVKILDANELVSQSLTATLCNGELVVRLRGGRYLFDDEGGVEQLVISPQGVTAVSAKGTKVELHALGGVEQTRSMSQLQRSIAAMFMKDD